MEKKIFNALKEVIQNQPWLNNKEIELSSLFKECTDSKEEDLIRALLSNFVYLDFFEFQKARNELAKFIVEDSGFKENDCMIVATAYDHDADSSQFLLQSIKIELVKNNWNRVVLRNNIGGAIRKSNSSAIYNLILIDEFVGSGDTIINRINYINKTNEHNYNIKCCFIAAMQYGLDRINEAHDVEIFCYQTLKRGISDNFSNFERMEKESLMINLEKNLADEINMKNLSDYSFGYNKAEALYSSQEVTGNSPNSIFPIFWWPKSNLNKDRSTLLNRFEEGF